MWLLFRRENVVYSWMPLNCKQINGDFPFRLTSVYFSLQSTSRKSIKENKINTICILVCACSVYTYIYILVCVCVCVCAYINFLNIYSLRWQDFKAHLLNKSNFYEVENVSKLNTNFQSSPQSMTMNIQIKKTWE